MKLLNFCSKLLEDDVLSVLEWFKRFKEGRTSVKDNERPGRPSTSKTNETVARVREIIRNNRQLTIREVIEDVGISYDSCQEILTKELGMSRIAAKFVPRLLTDEQKQNRKTIKPLKTCCPRQNIISKSLLQKFKSFTRTFS